MKKYTDKAPWPHKSFEANWGRSRFEEEEEERHEVELEAARLLVKRSTKPFRTPQWDALAAELAQHPRRALREAKEFEVECEERAGARLAKTAVILREIEATQSHALTSTQVAVVQAMVNRWLETREAVEVKAGVDLSAY